MGNMRTILMCILVLSMVSFSAQAEEEYSTVQVAFVRDQNIWTKMNNNEARITNDKSTYSSLAWSFDGSMLLYQKETNSANSPETKQNEIWVYDVDTGKHMLIYHDGQYPKWSPVENIVAYQSRGVLNVSDLNTFYNIALGVDTYEWQPDGKGFVASSSANLLPTGWTRPSIYTISIKEGYQNLTSLTQGVEVLFEVPPEVKKGDVTVNAIHVRSFVYSPNHKWISFIVSPTASLSMDSNMLCVLSADGRKFEEIDEVILHLDEPKWAYSKNVLGYIAGGGRIVLGFKNKDLKLTEIQSSTMTLTPPNFAELGFSWVNDSSLIVSRVPERNWSNDPEKRPNPSLFHVDVNGLQYKITTPPKNLGDEQPMFLPAIDKITWIRREHLEDKGDLWVADSNGHNARVWIRNVEAHAIFSSEG